MIDEYWTFRLYGYHSDELKPYSEKPVVVVCEDCGKYRVRTNASHGDLCRSCSMKGKSPGRKKIATCNILKKHAQDLKDDPERLSTEFLQKLIGVECE